MVIVMGLGPAGPGAITITIRRFALRTNQYMSRHPVSLNNGVDFFLEWIELAAAFFLRNGPPAPGPSGVYFWLTVYAPTSFQAV